MEIIKVEGIVLTTTNYSESSKILNVLTKEKGKISVLSKGCCNVKSKLRSVSNKLIYGYFNIYYKENGLSTLICVDVIDCFKNILTDITRIGYVSYITELVEQVVKQVNDNNIFELYINTLLKINEKYDPSILTNIIELKLLDYLGVMPVIDSCSLCGSEKQIITIDSDSGGYVCKNCYTNQKLVSEKTIKLIRLFYYVDISKITKLELCSLSKKEINSFIEEYYDKYTGLYLKSKKFLDKIVVSK
jgi:DNA repair protein RecO (recombination protein O)